MRVLMAPALMNVIVWKRSTEQCVRLTTVGWLVDHVSPNVCEVLIKAGAVCASCFLLIFIWSIIRTPIVNILWKGIYEASTDHSFCKERRAETKSNLWAIVRWRVGAGGLFVFDFSVPCIVRNLRPTLPSNQEATQSRQINYMHLSKRPFRQQQAGGCYKN